MAETGTFVWFDFGTRNETRAMQFYKSVLGWSFESMGPGYWTVKVGTNMIGALRQESSESFTPAQGFVAYFAVPSITEAKSLVVKEGGQLVGESVNIGEHGYFQLFKDLDGNQLSLWSSKP